MVEIATLEACKEFYKTDFNSVCSFVVSLLKAIRKCNKIDIDFFAA